MAEETTIEVVDEKANWKQKALIMGAVIGAVTGLGATYMLIQRSRDEDPPTFTAGEGVKLGLLVLGLMRQVAQLNE